MDQTEIPLLEGIRAFHDAGFTPFTTPGHKAGRGISAAARHALGEEPFRDDVSLMNGVDDRSESVGVLDKAQRLAAALYGADQVVFSVNGSSLSIQALLTSLCGPGDEVLVARNAHKSLIAALILSGAHPVYLLPELDRTLDFAHGVSPESLAAGLARHPAAKAAVIVSPTYLGVAADVPALAEISHACGVPLLVDEAWGPHLPFHPALPPSALHAGADASVVSVHKMLAGIGQASMIMARGERIDLERLAQCVDLLESTSASPLMLGSIDAARQQMATMGERLLERTIRLAESARAEIAAMSGLAVLGHEVVGRPGAAGFDPTKLTIEVAPLGVSGYAASDWLRAEQRVTVELADHRRIMAVVTIGDDEATVARLVEAIAAMREWAASDPGQPPPPLPPLEALATTCALTPREAFFARAERVPIDRAPGRVIAETISPYPPGIPVLAPGEVVTEAIVAYLKTGLAAGMLIPDATDSSLETLRVVA